MISSALRRLPAGLESLTDLALDLRWTWSHATDRLWESLDATAWQVTRNPWLILQAVSQARLRALAQDPAFLNQLTGAVADRRAYLEMPAWYERTGSERPPLVAYFCLEYGIAEALPLYSGGLGILAGDTLKTASDLGLPMVAVGLLYHQGYARQMLDADGAQQEFYPANAPGDLPIAPALRGDGAWLTVPMRLPGRIITLRVWRAQVGRVPLLLLDSNHPFNSPADRGITNTLYPASQENRFLQEIVLGIGGWQALRALDYRPDVLHLNEGHAALATIERARCFMHDEQLSFDEALWATRAGNVFTTHTSVAAALHAFPMELVRKYGRVYAASLGVDEPRLAAMGHVDAGPADGHFSMTSLALRTCGAVNAVSRIHGDVSRRLFQGMFPRRPPHEVPIGHITNGVHVPSWDSAGADRLWTETCGKDRWRTDLAPTASSIHQADDRSLWALAGEQRQALVRHVRERLTRQLGQRGADDERIAAAAHVLDPNALTLGMARRFTAYKRPNLLLHDPDRLARLLTDPQRPVQLVIAGKAHPLDSEGKRLLREWTAFAQRPELRTRVVFLEDYDIDLARQLVQGVDVWLNTPRRPWEACGTSGMKTLVNGGLNLSVLDGWWAEAWDTDVGWAIAGNGDSDAVTDRVEAEQLYRALETQVLPMFYTRDPDGLPRPWLHAMRESLTRLAPRFSSNRMLREYVDTLYRPAAADCRRRCADHGRVARELLQWHAALADAWSQVRFGGLDVSRSDDAWRLRVQVYLGEIEADAVAVELYAEPTADDPITVRPMQRAAAIDGAINGWCFETLLRSPRPVTDFTPRVVPHHPDARVPIENTLVHWRAA